MQASVQQQLDELIEESREIEAQAEKLQAAGPLNLPSSYAVERFQERADRWYRNALEVLPAELRQRFEQAWTGPEGDCGPQDFVAEPTGTGPDQRHTYDKRQLQMIDPTKFGFTYPYERCFREPLLRQRRILVEAKHHPDISRRSHVDELGVVITLDFNDLHPKIVNAAGALFADAYYDNAIFQACTALTGAIKEKSGVSDRDGNKLIDHVFSIEKPILKVAGSEDERKGMMWLFKGVVMGLRHPRAHYLRDEEIPDATEAFEWLAFISALMRVIDRSERVNRGEDEQAPPIT